jgi:hypothetical protein
MRIFCLLLLVSFIDQIDRATAQTPLFAEMEVLKRSVAASNYQKPVTSQTVALATSNTDLTRSRR